MPIAIRIFAGWLGFWEHVALPRRDRWAPGTRVPTMAIGPMAKRGFVDRTPYDHGSILRTIHSAIQRCAG